MRVTRRVWRHVPVGAEPLHLGWILKAGRGRWNSRRPRLPCLYTSFTPETAIAEFEKHVTTYGAGALRRDLVSIDVSVGPVLDLTCPAMLRRYGLSAAALGSDDPYDLARCRALAARAIIDDDHRAILAPSAALPGGTNLMIYIESRAGRLELANGPDRITITPGFRLGS